MKCGLHVGHMMETEQLHLVQLLLLIVGLFNWPFKCKHIFLILNQVSRLEGSFPQDISSNKSIPAEYPPSATEKNDS